MAVDTTSIRLESHLDAHRLRAERVHTECLLHFVFMHDVFLFLPYIYARRLSLFISCLCTVSLLTSLARFPKSILMPEDQGLILYGTLLACFRTCLLA